jgi:serine/threonine-protein kinase
LDKTKMIGRTIAHYKILEKVGQGGMAEVYLVEDTKLHRRVALKCLPAHAIGDTEARARFEREAQVEAALNHPNIVTIYEIGEVGEQFYIAMEYIEGASLRELIDEKGLPFQKVIDLAIQICEGLSKAHKAGIIHRDIKPENILVDQDGRVKILDFGLAKLKNASRLTEADSTVGTVEYMSPEQAKGESIDHRTDLWALGIVLYEAATGKLPFTSESKMAILYQIVNEDTKIDLPRNSGMPEELELILKKALQRDRNERYQSVDDLLQDLRALKEGSQSGTPIQLLSTTTHFRRKRSLLHKGLITFFVLLLIGGFYFRSEIFNLKSKILNPQSVETISFDKRRIAVLPFSNLSPDPKDEYFSDGITEELISSLSKINDLRVIARTSVMKYKTGQTSIADIGRELKVGTILEGSVRKEGDKVRITAQLIDVQSQAHLWSQEYDQELENVFAIQSDVARSVAEAMKMKLLAVENQQIEKKATSDIEAYTWYLRGLYFQGRRTEEGLKTGIEYFNRAIEKDGNYALAYTGLANSYNLLAIYGYVPPLAAYPKAKEALEKALKLDDSLAEAHTSLAFARHRFDWDWSGAEIEFRRALALNPSYATAHHWYSLYLMQMGRNEESLAEIKRARELDPLSLPINTDLGVYFYYTRQYDRAIEQFHEVLKIDPNFTPIYLNLGTTYEQKGLYEEAIAMLQKGMELSKGNPLMAASLGHAYAVAGKREEAYKVLEKLKDLSKHKHILSYPVAFIYIGLGDKDAAFEWLQKAYEERSGWLIFLKVNPLFDSLRADSRFIELLKAMGLEK